MRRFLVILLTAACTNAPTPASTTDAQAAPSEDRVVVATINGEPIVMADIEAEASAEIMQKKQELYDVERQALDGIIGQKVLAAEAAKRGITEEELMKVEVEDKVPAPDPAEVARLYEQSKPRLGGATLDEVRPRIEQFLGEQAKGARFMAFVDELRAAANVKVNLSPPRFEVVVPEGAPSFGAADAPVTIVEFSDFQCPYCSRGAETITAIKARYGDTVRVVFRNYPLDFHDKARKAAEASLCAHDAGKFWEYHDKLFANQSALAEADLLKYAADLEIEAAAFETCLTSGKYAAQVQADMEAGQALGVSGTPGFFVNGRFLGGAQPVEAFAAIIDEEVRNKQ